MHMHNRLEEYSNVQQAKLDGAMLQPHASTTACIAGVEIPRYQSGLTMHGCPDQSLGNLICLRIRASSKVMNCLLRAVH